MLLDLQLSSGSGARKVRTLCTSLLPADQQPSDELYTTPAGSNDDWYWLHAAVTAGSGGILVTNDELRDHVFQMLPSPRLFYKWKERHQVRGGRGGVGWAASEPHRSASRFHLQELSSCVRLRSRPVFRRRRTGAGGLFQAQKVRSGFALNACRASVARQMSASGVI